MSLIPPSPQIGVYRGKVGLIVESALIFMMWPWPSYLTSMRPLSAFSVKWDNMCLVHSTVGVHSGDSYISYLSAPWASLLPYPQDNWSLASPSLPLPCAVFLSPYHFLSPIIGLFCHDSCPRVVCFFLHFLPALLFEWFFPVSFRAGKTSIVSTTVGLRSNHSFRIKTNSSKITRIHSQEHLWEQWQRHLTSYK